MTVNTDHRLVKQALAGQRDAFDALVERHMGMVYAIACARLGDRDRAEDLAQEVFLRAFLALDKLDDPQKFTAWLSQITRNLAISWIRREGRGRRLVSEIPLGEEVENLPDAQAKGVRHQMETEEQQSAVWKAIKALPEEEREMVLLHYTEGISASEIGQRLGVHQTTVSRRIQRALKQMKGTVEPMLREAAPALRPTGMLTTRTLGVIAGAAAMTAASKTALAATAAQEVTTLAQASAGSVFSLNAVWTAIIVGGKAMATGKGIVATVAAALAIGGGIAVMQSDSQPSQPIVETTGGLEIVQGQPSPPSEPVEAAPAREVAPPKRAPVNPADQVPTPNGSTTPSLYVLPADMDPDADATEVPSVTLEEWLVIVTDLEENLNNGTFAVIEPDGKLLLHGSGISLSHCSFSLMHLDEVRGDEILTPTYTAVSETGGPWLVEFEEPLDGALLGMTYTPNTSQLPIGVWGMRVAGDDLVNPGVFADIEQMAQQAIDNGVVDALSAQELTMHEPHLSQLATALEAYQIDWNDYPPASTPGVNADDWLYASVSSFAGGQLTTPIAYLVYYPIDPNSPTGSATYAYTPLEDPREREQIGDYVLLGCGPDGDWDLTPLIGGEGSLSLRQLVNGTYDATNGLASGGDVLWIEGSQRIGWSQ